MKKLFVKEFWIFEEKEAKEFASLLKKIGFEKGHISNIPFEFEPEDVRVHYTTNIVIDADKKVFEIVEIYDLNTFVDGKYIGLFPLTDEEIIKALENYAKIECDEYRILEDVVEYKIGEKWFSVPKIILEMYQ